MNTGRKNKGKGRIAPYFSNNDNSYTITWKGHY